MFLNFFFQASSGDSSLSTPTKSLQITRSVLSSFNDRRDSAVLDIQTTADVESIDKSKPVRSFLYYRVSYFLLVF